MPICPNPTLALPDRLYQVIADAAARPVSGLVAGWMVYQTDVAAAFRYDGTRWMRLGDYGFHVTRSTNDAVITTGTSDFITFDTQVRNVGFITSFATTDTFTVPADGAGIYSLAGGAYWAANVAAIYVSISVGGVQVAGGDLPSVAVDRQYVSNVVSVAAGAAIQLKITNSSGGSITPTAYSGAGDENTPAVPYLAAWRMYA